MTDKTSPARQSLRDLYPDPYPAEVRQALREMHPDPFVQAAIHRLYKEAPGLLDHIVLTQLHEAAAAAHAITDKGV